MRSKKHIRLRLMAGRGISVAVAVWAIGIGATLPVHAKKTALEKTIFSSPDADRDVTPTYVGKNGQPFNAGRDLRTQGLNTVRQITSLTKEQRVKLNTLQSELNLRVSSLREHIVLLQGKLDVAKGHPGAEITIGKPGELGETLPNAITIRRQISGLQHDIESKQRDAADAALALLTPAQVEEYGQMRRGELMISGASTASTATQEEKPAPKAKRTGTPGALKRLFSRGK